MSVDADGRTTPPRRRHLQRPVAVEAAETASMVVVKVTARDDTSQDCRDGIEVVLVRPLGDRALIDGSTGRPVRVGASSE